ncbi:DinB family protein [Scopulibacillus darangshiensis]|uniref:DinB family protein n=1 Tax=Scopulibacillus darangshiensis TaxID=442528 RepID=A0A4R2P2U4_9BACL|nr:DinB family protein [Scopulibacillus darangshiensis]TCP29020.1 DinB family protein [Scopulibacillus darangshiensis]
MNKLENSNLVKTRNRLINEIDSLDFDTFNSKPDRDTWSIAQVCHHLILAEKSTSDVIASGLTNADSKAEPKEITLALDRSRKVNAPDFIKPDTEPFDVQQIIDLLNDSRSALLSILSSVEDKTVLARKSVKHLVFGDLPLNQWVDFIYLHEARHIAQIEEIKSEIRLS